MKIASDPLAANRRAGAIPHQSSPANGRRLRGEENRLARANAPSSKLGSPQRKNAVNREYSTPQKSTAGPNSRPRTLRLTPCQFTPDKDVRSNLDTILQNWELVKREVVHLTTPPQAAPQPSPSPEGPKLGIPMDTAPPSDHSDGEEPEEGEGEPGEQEDTSGEVPVEAKHKSGVVTEDEAPVVPEPKYSEEPSVEPEPKKPKIPELPAPLDEGVSVVDDDPEVARANLLFERTRSISRGGSVSDDLDTLARPSARLLDTREAEFRAVTAEKDEKIRRLEAQVRNLSRDLERQREQDRKAAGSEKALFQQIIKDLEDRLAKKQQEMESLRRQVVQEKAATNKLKFLFLLQAAVIILYIFLDASDAQARQASIESLYS